MSQPPFLTSAVIDPIVSLATGGRPDDLLLVTIGISTTLYIIWREGGRGWAFLYFLTIPFLNWSFGVVDPWCIVRPLEELANLPIGEDPRYCLSETRNVFADGIELHPLTLVTGLVFVFRDFVQRQMGQKVLIVMALAIAWSFYYAWPVIALASGLAFAVSETVDWLLFTFTRYRLSTRILLSSAVASPIDTTLFLYGADLAVQIRLGEEPGTMLHAANWIVFVIGKMVGAVIVSHAIRRREIAGTLDPQSA